MLEAGREDRGRRVALGFSMLSDIFSFFWGRGRLADPIMPRAVPVISERRQVDRSSPGPGYRDHKFDFLGYHPWLLLIECKRRDWRWRNDAAYGVMRHMIDDVFPDGFLPTICGTDC